MYKLYREHQDRRGHTDPVFTTLMVLFLSALPMYVLMAFELPDRIAVPIALVIIVSTYVAYVFHEGRERSAKDD